MSEFRLDPLSGQLVLYAPSREFRGGLPGQAIPTPDLCPFCPGQEHRTPPEIWALRPPLSQPNDPQWQVRVFQNQYPAVSSPPTTRSLTLPPLSPVDPRQPAEGWHEVIVETRDHDRGLADLPVTEMVWVLQVWRDRLRALRDSGGTPGSPRCEWALIFKNSGPRAGASQPHSHSQLLGLPSLPPGNLASLPHLATPPTLAPPDLESASAIEVWTCGPYRAVCPAVSRWMYEVHLQPQGMTAQFADEPLESLPELARLLRRVLTSLTRLVSDLQYNLVLHTGPLQSHLPGWRWRLELLPRLQVWGGFELGTGCVVNPLMPEEAARRLTEVGAE